MSQKCIVQFVWPQHDEGDYLCYREMTDEQVAEVSVLLEKAEDEGRIRSGWYVGPLGESTDSHDLFFDELKRSLNLCCCVPTLDEAHPACPEHGEG